MRRLLLLSSIALLAAPASASAAYAWVHDSPVEEQSTGYLACAGTQGGVLEQVLPSIDFAEANIDQAALPPVDGVQYVRVQWFATGGDYCRQQGGTGAAIEIIPPSGTELAISAESPAFCGFDTLQDAAPCPVKTLAGDYGGTLLADGRSGEPRVWPVSDGLNKMRLHVPIRFKQELRSYATSAERRCDAGPCPADQSNGRVQFAVRFVPGNGGTPSAPLVTTVGVAGGIAPAAATPTPGPGQQPGAGAPLAPPAPRRAALLVGRVPRQVTRATLRRGWALKLKAPAGATAKARLLSGTRALVTVSRRAGRGGAVTLRLKAGTRALRRLGRSAKLELTVLRRGTATTRQTVSLRVAP